MVPLAHRTHPMSCLSWVVRARHFSGHWLIVLIMEYSGLCKLVTHAILLCNLQSFLKYNISWFPAFILWCRYVLFLLRLSWYYLLLYVTDCMTCNGQLSCPLHIILVCIMRVTELELFRWHDDQCLFHLSSSTAWGLISGPVGRMKLGSRSFHSIVNYGGVGVWKHRWSLKTHDKEGGCDVWGRDRN